MIFFPFVYNVTDVLFNVNARGSLVGGNGVTVGGVGSITGVASGVELGTSVAAGVGTVGVGTCVGVVVGATVGVDVGTCVGAIVGATVGVGVGVWVMVGVTVGIGCSSPTKSTRDILLPVFEWVSVTVLPVVYTYNHLIILALPLVNTLLIPTAESRFL